MTYRNHFLLLSALTLVLGSACGSGGSGGDGDGDGSGGMTASGGASGGGSGGSASGGGGSAGSGGKDTASGGDEGSGGDGNVDPPIIPNPPEVEDKCAGADATTNCIWVTGHFGSTEVDFDCSEDAVAGGGATTCLDDYFIWSVVHQIEENGDFLFDINPSNTLDAARFGLGDADLLSEDSPSFAGTHCEGTYQDGSIMGTCYGAWGDDGSGNYESEVSASFRL